MKNSTTVFLLSLVLSVLSLNIVVAQTNVANTKVTSSSSQGSFAQIDVDKLCQLSNGDTIPCAYKDTAEKDIEQLAADGGIRKPIVDGVKLCPVMNVSVPERFFLNPTGYFDCQYFDANGSPKLNLYTTFFYKVFMVKTALVIILLVSLYLLYRFIIRKSKNNNVLSIMFALFCVALAISGSKVFADVPVATTAFCLCVDNNTKTCATEDSDNSGGIRYSCHKATNTYNIVSFAATGNTSYASTDRINVGANATLLNNITSNIPAVNSITNSSTVVASNSIGWDSGVVCNRQGLTGTLHFTGYKMETDPGGGVGHGNGTGSGLYPRATYSCYQELPPVPQNGACGNNSPGDCGSGNNCSVGTMTSCNCIGSGCADGMTYNCSGVNGGSATSCREFWCLTADTLITMADGTKKPIGELVEGDKVIGQTRVNTIVVARNFTTYEYVYGINGSTPFVTGGHPFMTKKGWRAIDPDKTPESVKNQINPGKLAIGDEILLENGTYMKVETITPSESPKGTVVYNPGLDGDNTYYANGMLVHNK